MCILLLTEVLDGSQRSLRSVSLENNLSQVTSGRRSGSTTPVRPILKPQPYTDPGSGRDTVDCSYKAPSYLGISCAVNGYNRLNRYDSSLRDGFRSRDASPARLAFSRSRDSSPMRPEWKVFDHRTKVSPEATAAKIKELKEELARFKAEFPQPPGERGRQNLSNKKLSRRGSQGRSISVDRGYLTKAGSRDMMNGHNGTDEGDCQGGQQRVRLVEITMTDASPNRSPVYQKGGDNKSGMHYSTTHTTSITSHYSAQHSNGDTPDKSFIQSRIERLYGPSALGAGFRSRRSLLELEKEQRERESSSHTGTTHSDNHYDPDAKAPEGFPSVFRHLRPEFRTQLQVKKGGLSPKLQPGSHLDSLSNVESPKRPGRVIPITIETEEPQKPPVLHPKPCVTPTNDLNHRTKPVNRDPKPVLPQKVVNGVQKKNEKQQVNGNVGEGEGRGTVSAGERLTHSPSRTSSVNGLPESKKICDAKDPQEKDGHYFLKVVEGVVKGIVKEVEKVEAALEAVGSEGMSEEVRGNVLAAIGKARLLVSQKIQQFKGLCHKNIAGSAGEEFPTTNEDLAGFWDMVSIQVDVVNNLLKEIDTLRSNGWIEVAKSGPEVTTGRARRKPAPRPARPATKSSNKSGEKSEEGKSRDEARRKMMEERRKAMKEAMKAKKAEAENTGGGDAVEIFVPETK
ncbi:hypothetical protein Pcinc_013325 [Petrolisthes cinctipes]|uniref:Uncharacterized protein n=1 Tax=Petrolisthes cinctipes TaxID=88211 RepID=A0AAE1KUF4_PETCI|nr:hypothetical protein Pcinc_013325 [Petrolisthes cinctipes]